MSHALNAGMDDTTENPARAALDNAQASDARLATSRIAGGRSAPAAPIRETL
jgi:hypothetical protein